MEIKAKIEDVKETVKQKMEWVKDNPKEAIKFVGAIILEATPWVVSVIALNQSAQKQTTINALSENYDSLTNKYDSLSHKHLQTQMELLVCQQAIDYFQNKEIESQQLTKRLASDALRHGSSEGGKTMNGLRTAK